MTKQLESAITLKNFGVKIGNFQLEPLSLDVKRGECLGIVGESGSGKSLLAKAIAGILPADASICGEYFFQTSADCWHITHAHAKAYDFLRGKRIGYVFQEPMTALNPSIWCGSQVDEVLKQHTLLDRKTRRQKVLSIFDEVQLPNPTEVYNKYPHQLSGGQRQRVIIAMAMINEPEVLIADEPTTALDVTVQAKVMELFSRLLKKYRPALLFISHDLPLVSQLADNLLVLKEGRLQEHGSLERILQKTESVYTRKLLENAPIFQKDLYSVRSQGSLCPLIKAEGLHKVYKGQGIWPFCESHDFLALKNLSFTIYAGDAVGIVGESGSGKTTLSRVVMQLLAHEKGQIDFFDKSGNLLKCTGRNFRKRVQLVFQDPLASLNPGFTVYKTLAEAVGFHFPDLTGKEKKARVVELLEQVELDADYMMRYPHQLSGGQRQRICIARALAGEPAILVCDEAVSALDVTVQAEVVALLAQLQKQRGLTLLFVSHDLEVVRMLCNRVLILKSGEIVEQGETKKLFAHPQTAYTRQLLKAIPQLAKPQWMH